MICWPKVFQIPKDSLTAYNITAQINLHGMAFWEIDEDAKEDNKTLDTVKEPKKEMRRPVTLWDAEDEKSIYNMTDERISKLFLEIKEKNADYFTMDEDRLYKRLKSEKKKPTPTDNRLRYSFWSEYERAVSLGHGKMYMTHVYGGVCTKEYFYDRYIRNPARLVWMLCPPTSYEVYVEEALNFGMAQLRKMLSYDDFKNGVPNMKLMELKAKIVNMLDQRKHGLAIARTETKALNVNMTTKTMTEKVTEDTMKRLEADIKRLEKLDTKPDIVVPKEKDDG